MVMHAGQSVEVMNALGREKGEAYPESTDGHKRPSQDTGLSGASSGSVSMAATTPNIIQAGRLTHSVLWHESRCKSWLSRIVTHAFARHALISEYGMPTLDTLDEIEH